MQQRLFANLLLLFCVIGLAIFLITTREEDEIKQSLTLTNIPADSIHTIQVERRDLDDIIFQKHGNYWHMQSPFSLPVHASKMELILELLHMPSYHQISAADNDLTQFQLALPAISVALNDTRILFGGMSPIEEKLRYVLAKDTVHIINDGLFYYLQSSPTIFIEPRLIPANAVLKSIKLPTLHIENTVDLQLTEAHRRIMDAWTQAAAISVRRYEETDPIDSIKLELMDGEMIQFAIIADKPNLILARPDKGVQYYIDDTVVMSLFPMAAQTAASQE